MTIAPHGGTLVERWASPGEAAELERMHAGTPGVTVDAVTLADLEMLAIGGYSPLTGFMKRADQRRVADDMRLQNGTLWPIPITLGAPADIARGLRPDRAVPLRNEAGELVAVLELQEAFERDVADECRKVFLTDSPEHPGAEQVMKRGSWCLAGPVRVLPSKRSSDFAAYRLTPKETRGLFEQRGWKKVVGFQTRNPVHRAHEYIIKTALEICDGLLLHPLVGFTKSDDIPADVRMECYQALLSAVFPKERVALSVMPAPMRYAGPREAILHAIIRKNFGCTHFIVGRDHAGVGKYYGTYDAQKIFDTFPRADLGIEPLMFENSFFCRACGQMGTAKTCPHPPEQQVSLSGTKVREMLKAGQRPPVEFSRPEVADVLIRWARSAN